MVFRDVRIEYTEGANHLTAHIEKHRILDPVGVAERTQNLARIVCDRSRIDSMRLEILERMLQLDELIAAVRSPECTAAEDQQQAVLARQIPQRAGFPVLIGKGKARDLLANLRPGAHFVVLCGNELQPLLDLDRFSCRTPAKNFVQDSGFRICLH
jgi:hypothetical protein